MWNTIFEKDGLKLSAEDGFIHANGTTLGGDDGIAVAYGLAILDSNDLAHPALEVLITTDEEIGLLGAKALDCSVLKGRRFINLDSEAEGSLWISCAGGLSGVSHIPVQRVEAEGEKLQIKICGLMGGHSGAEIDKKRANANVLMGRFFYGLKKQAEYQIVSLAGGQKDNAITRECVAEILVDAADKALVKRICRGISEKFKRRICGKRRGNYSRGKRAGRFQENALHPTSREKVVFYLMNVPFGIVK